MPEDVLKKGSLGDLIQQDIKRDTFEIKGWIDKRKELPKNFDQLSENVSFNVKKADKLSKCKVFIKKSEAEKLKNKIQSDYDNLQKSYNIELEKWKVYENTKKKFIQSLLQDMENTLSSKEKENPEDAVELRQIKNILFSKENKALAERVFKIKANADIKFKAGEIMKARAQEIKLGGGYDVQIFTDKLDKSEPYDGKITSLLPVDKTVTLEYEMSGVKKTVNVPLTNLCIIGKEYQSTRESLTETNTEEENKQEGGRKFQGGSINYPTKKKISSEFSISTSSLCE